MSYNWIIGGDLPDDQDDLYLIQNYDDTCDACGKEGQFKDGYCNQCLKGLNRNNTSAPSELNFG